jgi:ABC-type branched-subunit amino acid transport system substrate-binding protein
MYLDAMARLSLDGGHRRWFVVHEDADHGRALADRARLAVSRVDGLQIVDFDPVPREKPVYAEDVAAASSAGADVIVLLLNDSDQISFLAQYDMAETALPTLTFPYTITQTRDYIAAARYLAPKTNPARRIALWETTLRTNGADQFNDRFQSQFGQPADPTGWAAYHAIKIYLQAVQATGSADPEAIVGYLENPGTTFDLLKGPGISFRTWDHQLRQPLYAVNVDQNSEWSRMSLESRIGVASFGGELPAAADGDDPAKRLDQLGDDATQSRCKL